MSDYVSTKVDYLAHAIH